MVTRGTVFADAISDDVNGWIIAVDEVSPGVWQCCEYRSSAALAPSDVPLLMRCEHHEIEQPWLDRRALASAAIRDRVRAAYESFAESIGHPVEPYSLPSAADQGDWTHDPMRDGSGCSWCGAFAQVNADNECRECFAAAEAESNG